MEGAGVGTMNGGTLGTIGARITCRLADSIIGRLPTSERQIFLTIDDGPTEQSERLADILHPHGVSATWFLVGISAERNSSAVKHIAAAGHDFGNHSYRHVDAWLARWSRVESDLNAGLEAVQQITGAPCLRTRPPFGRIRPGTLSWRRKHNQDLMLWDVLAYDYRESVDPAKVTAQVRSAVRPGSIVVMHDKPGDHNLETLERTVAGLLSDGWTFGRLPAPVRT